MAVTLINPELEKFVREQVKFGAFPSPEALLEEAVLRLMEDTSSPLSAEETADLMEANAEIDRGEGVDWAVIKAGDLAMARPIHALAFLP